MSINWVMLTPEAPGFIKLPNECISFTSPPRVSLELTASSTSSGARSFSIKSDGGYVFLTNQRVVYLPSAPTAEFKSFSCPILHLQDTHVCSPLFGPNYWAGICQPVPGGGIPPHLPSLDLKLTFREGGTFDFVLVFEQIKERLYQVSSISQEASAYGTPVTNVDLEQLPAYNERENRQGNMNPPPSVAGNSVPAGVNHAQENDMPLPIPGEAPPCYEEAQAQAVSIDFEQRLRAGCHGAQSPIPAE